jgi:hypothetical protein
MIITTLCRAAADVLVAPPGEAAEAKAVDAAAIAFDAPPNAMAGGDAAKIPAGIISVVSKTPAARIALRIMADTLLGFAGGINARNSILDLESTRIRGPFNF